MAVVLSSEDNGLFSSSALRRSQSQTKFMSKHSQHFHTSASASASHIADTYHQSYHIISDSSPSSAPSSPDTVHADSVTPSYSSTPATSLSLDGHCEDDDILLPTYDDNPYFAPLEDLEAPASPRTGDSYPVSPVDHGTPTTPSRPDSPELTDHAEDDTFVTHHPTQHVDYLSHNWREEDIWSSWRYIVSKRGEYSNASRLENASWRTWMKSKYCLKTISPETLNWLKDCDVTWLYGPLQTRQIKLFSMDAEHGSNSLSRCDSFIKKPILKKRSMSEVMLQKSISSSSLLKQATAAVQAQQDGPARVSRPILQRAATDFATFPFASRRLSRMNTSLIPSTNSSGAISPSAERKHIHFDEQVQQCIAVEVRGDEDEEEEADHSQWNYDDDSDSDDGGIMMKPTASKKKPLRMRKQAKVPATTESKTIAMLPSTTLKSKDEFDVSQDSAMRHSSSPLRSPMLSPSPSHETLRPSKSSGRFFVGGSDDEDDEEGTDTPVSSPVDHPAQTRGPSLQRSASVSSLAAAPAGMRRTESGMLMPYEEGDNQGNEGIIGRVIDTVNTARDIAHVIWNVGWKR
ncbi:uncharacterized protein PG986_007906 [Apiospora aurea]|uniref:Nitrogen regulatory protein areA GATA-like domain-containing protein n=1 Tax=Apiospora aurea TaxID=335848 RepID=A0ABR1QDY0_9PEZI